MAESISYPSPTLTCEHTGWSLRASSPRLGRRLGQSGCAVAVLVSLLWLSPLTVAASPVVERPASAALPGPRPLAPIAGTALVGQGRWHPISRLVDGRVGAASLVIYKDGSAVVGAWGRDATMTPGVVALRQNLNLLVDHGQPMPGLDPNDIWTWGPTLGGIPNVWRSGLGQTASGALVYVAGPSLTVVELASLLVRAGAVRAMELDINPYWTVFASFSPSPPNGQASPQNGADLLAGMLGTSARFFDPSWARDFITVSARPA